MIFMGSPSRRHCTNDVADYSRERFNAQSALVDDYLCVSVVDILAR